MNSIKKYIKYWRDSARKDWGTAEYLFEGKRYDACLFFVHLSIEKTLKGLITQETKEVAPYTHNLIRLAELSQIRYYPESSYNTSDNYNI